MGSGYYGFPVFVCQFRYHSFIKPWRFGFCGRWFSFGKSGGGEGFGFIPDRAATKKPRQLSLDGLPGLDI
jgi:hypothetical protein